MNESSGNQIPPEPEKENCKQISPEKEWQYKQVEIYFKIYKQHFDLAVKGFALYLAVLGAVVGFIFGTETGYENRITLIVATIIGSCAAFAAAIVSKRWVLDLEATLNKMTGQLGLVPFPFSGAKGIASVAMWVIIIFAVAGAAILYVLLSIKQ